MLSVIGLMGLLTAAATQDEGLSEWVTAMWPSPQACLSEKAVDVRLEDVLKTPHVYDGQCVRIKGYYQSRALFLEPDDMAIKYAQSSPETDGRRIGVSGSEATMDRLHKQYTQGYVEVIGIVWQCEDKGPWMGGYCHYVTDGPFIGINSVRATPEPMKYRDN